MGNNLVLIHSFLCGAGFKHPSKFLNPCERSNSRKSLFVLEVQIHVTMLMEKVVRTPLMLCFFIRTFDKSVEFGVLKRIFFKSEIAEVKPEQMLALPAKCLLQNVIQPPFV